MFSLYKFDHKDYIFYYDAVLLSGQYQIGQIRELEAKRGLPAKEMLTVGMPYMDAMKARLDAAPQEAHETTVLLAPSWGSSGILSRYGADIIRELLSTGYHLIVRPHPQSFTSEKELMDALMREFPDSPHLEWNRDNDNFDVLRRSDILISDFSGVIFDYSLVFGRPVIYADTSFDKAPYDACWIDEELWTFTTLPKIGKKLSKEMFPEMKSLIDGMLNDPQYREAIETARRETWEHIGESASLTADYMIRKRESLYAEKEK